MVKQRDNFGVPLPQELVDILQWHVETQLDERQLKNKKHLLFPGSKGATFRSLRSLAKPFTKVAQAIGVKLRFTQRGMRRTFNDLSRAAKLEPDIIRSISGHHTDQMREWYSTYRAGERRAGIAAVIDVVAAHRAVGEALGGSDFDDATSDDAAELPNPSRHPSCPSPEAWAGASPSSSSHDHGETRLTRVPTHLGQRECRRMSTESTYLLSTDWGCALGQTHVPIGTLVGTQLDSGTLLGLATHLELRDLKELFRGRSRT